MCIEFGKGHRKRKVLARGQIQSLELSDILLIYQSLPPFLWGEELGNSIKLVIIVSHPSLSSVQSLSHV